MAGTEMHVAPLNEANYQCASGWATHRADGTPMLFYGHTPLPRPDGTRPPRQQWAANHTNSTN